MNENYELVQVHKSGDEMEVLIRDKNGYKAFGGKLIELENPKSVYPPDYFEDTEFVRCEWQEAEWYRSRVLTGSLGLEGKWSDWKMGKPEKLAQNIQYEYRRNNESKF